MGGVTYVDNPKYKSEHVLSSIMCVESEISGKILVIYSDILFENSLIERLKSLESDFVIVVYNSLKKGAKRTKKI